MLDFVRISTRSKKQGVVEIYPNFVMKKSSDLMIRGGDFYAVWVEENGLWSTDEQDVIDMIDRELKNFTIKYKENSGNESVHTLYMWDATSGMIDDWHKYCQKQLRDNYHPLDEELIFSNMETKKTDYASKKLPYPLEQGNISAYNKLISTLYSEEERRKIEWAIGSIVAGDSKYIQKFMVLYGAAGTGKSTILNIIQALFEGYYSVFDAKALGSSNNSFALEAFKTNPLVAIQHDGDLSRIEDNTRLNSLVSHELMTVNEKFKSAYSNRFNAFLFMGTNKPVKITDGKSGLIRRLIDVSPSGNKLNPREYKEAMDQVAFELGGIAYHCKKVYLENPGAFDNYTPIAMLGASNDFYNFVVDSFRVFKKDDRTTLKAAWEMYKVYCEDARVPYPFSQRTFKEELKNYFREFTETFNDGAGSRNVYSGFRSDIFEKKVKEVRDDDKSRRASWIKLEKSEVGKIGPFEDLCSDAPAQYANSDETPRKGWTKVKTKLKDLDVSKLHYVKVPEWLIVIDFDLKDEDGNKSLEKNLEAASKWPATYAEVSKGGAGLHLHYIYKGDVSKLSKIYDKDIEIKVFTGNSSLRRKLTLCNSLLIATISSGLPMKEEKMISTDIIQSEKGLRTTIKKCLAKEVHPQGTKPNVDFIYKVLEDAYNSGMSYDVSDMKNAVYAFAAQSSNQSDLCIKLVSKMKFKSEEAAPNTTGDVEKPIIFFDCEVFPNLFLVNWKFQGKDKPIVRLINPRPTDIAELIKYRLIGFNCRQYDNHMLYACMLGYDNQQIYELSQHIINTKKGEKKKYTFGEAYNLSYTDVYDFASAGNKKSLKKLEIEMSNVANDPNSKMDDDLREMLKGIKHHELGLPWDRPVPESRWQEVAEYCDDDVIATEAGFYYLKSDWTARQILADLAGMSVNDTTNTLTTKFIFGNNKNPQNEFHYRNLAEPVLDLDEDTYQFLAEACPEMMSQTHGEAGSLLPYFPGYRYENGVSIYRGEEVGEGGYVYAEPGTYGNVALLDIASMHPHSTIAEVLFGVRYTRAFRDIVEGRVSIKHKAWDEVNHMLDGKLTPYIQKVIDGEMTAKDLANALKTAINSVYGLTSAKFDNAFRDIRNKDNIVAKRGALFMVDLKNEVQKRGFTVAHIKTDSIKIPDATPEIIKFVMDFGKRYGYTFEHEATYDRMCLVNNAVYIAKYKKPEECEQLYGYIPGDNADHIKDPWTATGKQFAVPYVFKTLFSKEPVDIRDMCETFSVKSALYLDMNEKLPDVSGYEKRLEKIENDYKKGKLSDTLFEPEATELAEKIAEGHDYHFVGKVGEFCPVKTGKGGGVLVREQEGKYYAATGTTGYRWLESDVMFNGGNDEFIDRSFYDKLVDDAVEAISKYGDFEWFVSDDPYVSPPRLEDFMNIPEDAPEEIPFA
ncbi:DUF5906 domain-containing protein [Blautia glucerasea]|uniref:DUF5906 domain-containing protein n=1 Tax=Blautia TaxID=572511 RepID=UPI00157102D9|nr:MULTISPECIES: DUF5906 domain-containing protein [Blautia]MCB5380987.1 DUF5906 domain-containing protein [Blautia glucerasea]NSJ69349.1 hypothetical protein [Blautia faecis]